MTAPGERPALDARIVRRDLRAFILGELLRNPEYPLRDDEPLFSGGLIDSFALARLGAFIERQFGVYIPDTELTTERLDSLDAAVSRIVGTGA